MKNWERYESEIKELGLGEFAVKLSGEASTCANTRCCECMFRGAKGLCRTAVVNWLYKDYEELRPRLTKEEKIFVDAIVHPGYNIRRNGDGLFLYGCIVSIQLKSEMFSFIDSGKSWTIGELKELEVEE